MTSLLNSWAASRGWVCAVGWVELLLNGFNKNDDIKKEIESKLATENAELKQELNTLKEEGNLTVKSLKEAGNALSKVEA